MSCYSRDLQRKTRAEFEAWKVKSAKLQEESKLRAQQRKLDSWGSDSDADDDFACGCCFGEWCSCEGPDVRCRDCGCYVEDEREDRCPDCYKKKYGPISIPRYEGSWKALSAHIRKKRQVTYNGVLFGLYGYMDNFHFKHECKVTLVHNTTLKGFLVDDEKNVRIHGNFNEEYPWTLTPESRGNPAVEFHWCVFEDYVHDAEGVIILPDISLPETKKHKRRKRNRRSR